MGKSHHSHFILLSLGAFFLALTWLVHHATLIISSPQNYRSYASRLEGGSCQSAIDSILRGTVSWERSREDLVLRLRHQLGAKKDRLKNLFSAEGRVDEFDFNEFFLLRSMYSDRAESSFEEFFQAVLRGEVAASREEFQKEQLLALIQVIQRHAFHTKSQYPILEDHHIRAFLLAMNQKKLNHSGLKSLISQVVRARTFGSETVSSLHDQLFYRLLTEEFIRHGIERTLIQYGMLSNHTSRVSAFFDSQFGRVLSTGFFNLPVLAGFPPLYLPGARPLILSQKHFAEIFKNGLTPRLKREILNDWQLDGPLWNLSSREIYETLRRYYMVGASTYVTYVLIYDFLEEYREIQRKGEFIEELQGGLVSTLEILEDVDGNSHSLDDDLLICRNIRGCFEMIYNELGEMPRLGESEYRQCKEFMDPFDQCQRY